MLRATRIWFGLCSLVLLGATVWLGWDLNLFAQDGGTWDQFPLRLLYVLLSETGKPVVQVALGSLLAAVFSWRCVKSTEFTQERSPSKETS